MKRKSWISIFLALLSTPKIVLGRAGDELSNNLCGGFGVMGLGGYGTGFFGLITGLLVMVVLILLIAWLLKQIQKK